MEGNVTKYEEKIEDTNNLPIEYLVYSNSESDMRDTKIPKKNIQDLTQDEQILRTHLDTLKKENFMLQASIKAWQTTLRSKLDEFKEADLKLDEIHNEIWSEREKFCSKADEFNDTYGILSDWWASQMKFVSDLETLERKTLEDRKCKEEIEKLEEEVEELKKEITELQTRQLVAEVEVHATEDGDHFPVREELHIAEVSSNAKKVKFADRIEVCNEGGPTKNDLYSIVDLDKLRMVNRNRNRLRKSQTSAKAKKLPTM